MAATKTGKSVLIQRTECSVLPLINLTIRKSLSCKCGFIFTLNDLKIMSVLKGTVLHLLSLMMFSSPSLHWLELVQSGVISQIGTDLADKISFFIFAD